MMFGLKSRILLVFPMILKVAVFLAIHCGPFIVVRPLFSGHLQEHLRGISRASPECPELRVYNVFITSVPNRISWESPGCPEMRVYMVFIRSVPNHISGASLGCLEMSVYNVFIRSVPNRNWQVPNGIRQMPGNAYLHGVLLNQCLM